MADKENKAAENSKAEKTASDESKAAAKVAKAAKGSGKKSDKPNVFSRMGSGIKRFFKDFKGESKKIVWPDAKTVLKSTGVVILVVAIVSIIIWGIDTGLTAGISGLKHLAAGEETTVSETVADSDEETTVAETTAESDSETTTEAETTAKAE
ncbi:MAG: preprotein translocase subunit SecE [Faecalibacterium sp.]|nr:preprotein translocase subunit SecE [Ruminococcus sp.]MCM1392482.1 preprotein translocase subunit SecE [Ruminococcus sp.]MCM1485173.1 preprotein translocase subunit SecE [Faecalibacterium sp.]